MYKLIRNEWGPQKASQFGEMSIQRLFLVREIISIKRNAHPGIILRRKKHPSKEKSSARDYSAAAEASQQGEKFSQGLLCSGRSISAKRNAHLGITLRRQKHLCKEKRSSRDYFAEAEASLQGEKLIQGLFCGGRSISARRKAHPGITLRRQKHLCKEKSSSRDYFAEAEASLQGEKFVQGCFDIKKSILHSPKII